MKTIVIWRSIQDLIKLRKFRDRLNLSDSEFYFYGINESVFASAFLHAKVIDFDDIIPEFWDGNSINFIFKSSSTEKDIRESFTNC